jgi:hypothetical protein
MKFVCPSCRKSIKVYPELAGTNVDCACGQRILVPDVPTAYDDPELAQRPRSTSLRGNDTEPYIELALTPS